MKVKLATLPEPRRLKTPAEMQSGEIGIIRKWSVGPYIGTVVQKNKKDLIKVGASHEEMWTDIDCLNNPNVFEIEILEPGDSIVIGY